MDPSLVAACALFIGACAFAVRALTPALVARINAGARAVSEDADARASARDDLERCHVEREILARRVAVLETRIAHLPSTE